jgi:bifunctional DNase/RNase
MPKRINDTTTKFKPMALFEYDQSIYCLLSQTDGNKEFFIEVGDAQAININYLLNKNIFKIKSVGLYDTFLNTLEKANLEITDLVIIDKKDKTFFGQIEIYNKYTNELLYEDCKPSELICLSLKLKKPIFVFDSLIKDKRPKKDEIKRNLYIKSKYDLDNLTKEFNLSIENENYELANELKIKIDNLKKDLEG